MESNGLSGHLVFVELLCEGSRREIAKSRLFTNAVVKDFDIFRDDAFGFLACRETLMKHELSLQQSPAAFHRGVIPAIALTAH